MSPRPDPSQQWSKVAPKMASAARAAFDEMLDALVSSPLPPPLAWAKVARDALLRPDVGTVLNSPSLGTPDRTLRLLALMIGKLNEEIEKQAAIVKRNSERASPGATNAADDAQHLQLLLKQESQLFEMLNNTINAQNKALGDALQNAARGS
jgi:hypothetical protein